MFRSFSSIFAILALALVGCPTPDDDESAGDDDTTQPACLPCEVGFTVRSEADLEVVAECSEIDGALQFWDQEWLTEIDLPCLERLKWGVSVTGNPNLTAVNLPALESPGTSITFLDNPSLDGTLHLPALTEVNMVSIGRNDALSAIELPQFATTEELSITSSPSLTTLDLPVLSRVEGEVFITDNPALTHVEIPDLTRIESDLQIERNDSLTGLDGLGALETVEGSLVIEENQSLGSLAGLMNLERVSLGVTILDNPCLDQSEAEDFATAVSPNGDVEVEGNDGPCE